MDSLSSTLVLGEKPKGEVFQGEEVPGPVFAIFGGSGWLMVFSLVVGGVWF